MKNRILCGLLSLGLCLSLATPALAATEGHFTDVPKTHWAYDYIEKAYADGAVNGTGGNAANHTGVFSPSNTLSSAQFIVMLMRAFYPERVETEESYGNTEYWFSAAVSAARRYGLDRKVDLNWAVPTSLNEPISRYNMAVLVNNILNDKIDAGIGVPSDEKDATIARIADYYDESATHYRNEMLNVVYAGIISGVDSKGTFAGNTYVSRAQGATIYCRMAEYIEKGGKVETGTTKPSEPTTPTTPSTPSTPSTSTETINYGAVGTLSDSPVTLSLSTHKCPTDYWSQAPADVRAITDKDMFNAAVQSLKDKDMSIGKYKKPNVYYNYACYEYDVNAEDQLNVLYAIRDGIGNEYDGLGRVSGLTNADSSNVGIIYYKKAADGEYDEVFGPIFSKFTSGMSDHEKVEIMIQAMCDRFEYGKGSFNWTNGKTVGVCKDYALAFSAICSAADIPVLYYGADAVNHAWNLVYIDGEWYYVDVSLDPSPAFELESVEKNSGMGVYDTIKEDADYIKVAKAIIEAVY